MEKDSIPNFGEWMTICQLEDRFWQTVDTIRENGGWFDAQHPPKPFTKVDNEYLPLVILAKHEAGVRRNWDSRLQVRVNATDRTEAGASFDAEYRFATFQPKLSESRCGYIEIVRGMSEQQSVEMKQRNRDLERKMIIAGPVADFDSQFDAMKCAILKAVKLKSSKSYPTDSKLIVWLREEINLHFAGQFLGDAGFREQIATEARGNFGGVCVLGVNMGADWVCGKGL